MNVNQVYPLFQQHSLRWVDPEKNNNDNDTDNSDNSDTDDKYENKKNNDKG